MPKLADEMGPLDVKRIAHPGGRNPVAVAVGGVAGLHLQVTPGGAKSWLLRIVIGGKRRWIGLGAYPEVALAAAKDRARETKDAVRRGVDPVEERKALKAALRATQKRGLLFKEAFEDFATEKVTEFASERYRKHWRSTIEMYALPELGEMLVSDIERQDILRALQPIWQGKTITAKKLRQRLERILDYAAVAGHRSGPNPAAWKGNLEHLLAAPSKISKSDNWPALALDGAAAWFADLRDREGMASRALEFLAVTAVRSGDVRGAVWDEIDLTKGMWTIPAVRMKMKREHRVPLGKGALELLQALPRLCGSPYVFPAPRGGPLSDMALGACMRRINGARPGAYLDRRSGKPAVPHGLRSTFRDWAAERTQFPFEMAELALAHNVGTEVARAYLRGDLVEKRRVMMDAWEQFLQGVTTVPVVKLVGVDG